MGSGSGGRVRASVIVCTHNRAALLGEALEGLARMAVPEGGAEVLVVDNASGDDTRAVAEGRGARLPVPFRYVFEPELGLSHARNRGIAESRGEVLAFLDDDAVPEPDWLTGLLAVYDTHPDAQCVGGRVLLNWRQPPPPWWEPDMDHHLSAVDHGDRVLRLTYPDAPYGANISFRRGVFQGRSFDPGLGRRGKALGGGEEMALCLAIARDGGGVYYAPGSVVHHLAEAGRANPGYLYRKSFLHGRSAALLEARFLDFDARVRTFANLAVQGVVQFLTAGRSVSRGCRWRFRAGYVWETLRNCLR